MSDADDPERLDDPDRAAILARRQRFVTLALSGLTGAFAAGCDGGGNESRPQPCLDVAAPPETKVEGPTSDGGEADTQAGATTGAVEAMPDETTGTTGAAGTTGTTGTTGATPDDGTTGTTGAEGTGDETGGKDEGDEAAPRPCLRKASPKPCLKKASPKPCLKKAPPQPGPQPCLEPLHDLE